MKKNELLSKELYTIVSTITEMPYEVDGKFIVLSSDIDKVALVAQKINMRFKGLYKIDPAMVSRITDNDRFFTELIYLGYQQFLYEDTGQILNLAKIYNIDYTMPEANKEFYDKYMELLCLNKSAHIGSAKQERIRQANAYINYEPYMLIKNECDKRMSSVRMSFEYIVVENPPKNIMEPKKPSIIEKAANKAGIISAVLAGLSLYVLILSQNIFLSLLFSIAGLIISILSIHESNNNCLPYKKWIGVSLSVNLLLIGIILLNIFN